MSVRWYLLAVGVLIAALIAVEAARPRPLDLRVRLEREGEAPFDAEVFYASLPDWTGQPVETVGIPAFERLADSTLTGRTTLSLALWFPRAGAAPARLLRFVERGNTVVVIAHEIDGPFTRPLGLPDSTDPELSGVYSDAIDDGAFFSGRATLAADTLDLVAPGVEGAYAFPVPVLTAELFGLDPERTEVLGVSPHPYIEADSAVTLVRIRQGRGEVVLSTTPLAFTNAALTGDGDAADYVGAVLAALPAQPILWDDVHKPYQDLAQTPLRYVLRTPALRWAYLLLVLAGLLFVAFRGRRWQRAVPVVAPPPNAQREFARVLGRLHFGHRDEGRLAGRMARVALDRMRTELRLAEPDLSPETARLAAARAGVPEDEALALFATLARVRRERRPDPDTLVRLDARLTRFFRHTV